MIGNFTLASQLAVADVGTPTTAMAINLANFTAQTKISGAAAAALTAEIELQVSNDPLAGTSPANAAWEKYTFTLSGTGTGAGASANSSSLYIVGVWNWARAKLNSCADATARVDMFLGGQ